MHHVAIMKKSWGLIPKILSGQKTIESRWYQTRRAPWDKIKAGDTVYFKNSGEGVSAVATVDRVEQFQIADKSEAQTIVDQYGNRIGLINSNIETWGALPHYCILIFLTNPRVIKPPFSINKSGFGSAAAWLCVDDIDSIIL